MEVMTKIVSKSDTTTGRLEFPAGSLWAFPMPDGQNSVEFVASDILNQEWRLEVSIRNEGRFAKPWLRGEWGDYARTKKLRKDDRVILTMNDGENGERIYRIRAERKHFGFWHSIDEQHLPWCSVDANQEANAGYNQEASADHEQEDQIEAEQGINKFPIMDTIAGILEDDRYK